MGRTRFDRCKEETKIAMGEFIDDLTEEELFDFLSALGVVFTGGLGRKSRTVLDNVQDWINCEGVVKDEIHKCPCTECSEQGAEDIDFDALSYCYREAKKFYAEEIDDEED